MVPSANGHRPERAETVGRRRTWTLPRLPFTLRRAWPGDASYRLLHAHGRPPAGEGYTAALTTEAGRKPSSTSTTAWATLALQLQDGACRAPYLSIREEEAGRRRLPGDGGLLEGLGDPLGLRPP